MEVDLESFRYGSSGTNVEAKTKRRKGRTAGEFIRGPLSVAWFARAATIPRSNALIVGLVVWYLAGLRSERLGLVLCVDRCKPFGLGRKGVNRGLADLEAAGLIRVDRGAGKCARVDLLEAAELSEPKATVKKVKNKTGGRGSPKTKAKSAPRRKSTKRKRPRLSQPDLPFDK